MKGDKFKEFANSYYDYAGRVENGNPAARELCWTNDLGIPILQYEASWGAIKQSSGVSVNGLSDLNLDNNKRIIMDHMKREMTKLDDFRVMFEYVFPVKKLFNFMFIQMDQRVSSFLVNTKVRGIKFPEGADEPGPNHMAQLTEELDLSRKSILAASNIDPEQFMQAKSLVKSILANVKNSDNYRYINAETEEAGGQGRLALNKQLKE
tara:strand:- start:629 stop:1252 length:624 start_codon:yes stop_codon:yes gene_type:complete